MYFEYKVLNHINGEPDFSSLQSPLLQLKSNAVLVPCHLGGGAHGFFGISLSPATYAILVPFTPFTIPFHPGPLVHLHGATQYQVAATTTAHNESLLAFHFYQLVQRYLVQQVLEAINPKYIPTLRNRTTGCVPYDIRSHILYLFCIYGKISPQKLRTRYDNVEGMYYKLEEPIDIIFDTVEDLVEIGELAGRPYTSKQVIHLGYIILSKTRTFRGDICKWSRKLENDKT